MIIVSSLLLFFVAYGKVNDQNPPSPPPRAVNITTSVGSPSNVYEAPNGKLGHLPAKRSNFYEAPIHKPGHFPVKENMPGAAVVAVSSSENVYDPVKIDEPFQWHSSR